MPKKNRVLYLAEYKSPYTGSGESVMQLAFYAQDLIDDPELAAAAKAAVEAEDQFDRLLDERGIIR